MSPIGSPLGPSSYERNVALDEERVASMADEGSVSAAHVELDEQLADVAHAARRRRRLWPWIAGASLGLLWIASRLRA